MLSLYFEWEQEDVIVLLHVFHYFGSDCFPNNLFAQLWLCRICQRSTRPGFHLFFSGQAAEVEAKATGAHSILFKLAGCLYDLTWSPKRLKGKWAVSSAISNHIISPNSLNESLITRAMLSFAGSFLCARCLHHWAAATSERHHHQGHLLIVYVCCFYILRMSDNGSICVCRLIFYVHADRGGSWLRELLRQSQLSLQRRYVIVSRAFCVS